MYDLFSLVPAQVYYYKMKWEKIIISVLKTVYFKIFSILSLQ